MNTQVVVAIVGLIAAVLGSVLTYLATRRKVDTEQKGAEIMLGAEAVMKIQAEVESQVTNRLNSLETRAMDAEEKARKAESDLVKDRERYEHEMAVLHEELDALRKDYDRLHKLVSETQVGVAVLDTDLRYLYVNELGARMNGVPRELHFGQKISRVLPGLAKKATPLLRDVMETKREYKGVFSSKGPDGRIQNWSVLYSPVLTEDQEVVALIGYFRLINSEDLAIQGVA